MSEWKEYSIEQLGKVITGYTPATNNMDGWEGQVPFYSPSDFGDKIYCSSTERTIAPKSVVFNRTVFPNTIMVTCIGSTIGKMAIVKHTGITNQQINALVCDEEFNPVFTFYNLKYNIHKLYALHGATAIPIVNKSQFSRIHLPFPLLPTQRKIACILSTIDGQIEKTEAIIAKYQAVKQGMLQDLFTRGIDVRTGQLRSRYKDAPDLYQESALGMIPKEWEVIGLGQLATISSGVTLGKKHEGPDTIKLPYLRVANVQDGYLDLSEITYITVPKSQVEKCLLHVGDVLMNEGGDFDKLGRGTIWRGEINNCLHQNHVFKVRCNPDRLSPEYLQIISSSPYGKRFFVLNSKQSTNLASINQTQLKSFPIILPHIQEQAHISTVITELTKNMELESGRLSKLQLLKQGLMQDLLSGKVEVTA